MFLELLKENLVVEITNLVNNSDDSELDEYCMFMKETILNTSGNN